MARKLLFEVFLVRPGFLPLVINVILYCGPRYLGLFKAGFELLLSLIYIIERYSIFLRCEARVTQSVVHLKNVSLEGLYLPRSIFLSLIKVFEELPVRASFTIRTW